MKPVDNMTTNFDSWFDTMMEMSKENPQAFEDMRQQMIDEVINEAPEKHKRRLVGLQWRVDQERKLAKTPMAACIRISELMWDSVSGEGGLIDNLNKISVYRNI